MEQTKSVLAQENLDRECLDNNNLDLTTQKRAGKKAASKRRWFWAAGICALTSGHWERVLHHSPGYNYNPSKHP